MGSIFLIDVAILFVISVVFHHFAQVKNISVFSIITGISFSIISLQQIKSINDIIKQNLKDNENIMLQQQFKTASENLTMANENYRKQRDLTHNFNAHLNYLYESIKENALEEAKDYIINILQETSKNPLLLRTGNSTLDIILNPKIIQIQQNNIKLEVELSEITKLPIASTEMVIVLTNAFSNAIEACLQLPLEKRKIQLKIVERSDEWLFSLRNTTKNPVLIVNNSVKTSKSDSLAHGVGLKNINSIIFQHKGLFALDYKNGWFQITISIPLTGKSLS